MQDEVTNLFDATVADYGTIGIRVVVLPRIQKGKDAQPDEDEPQLTDPEDPLPEEGKTAVASYLEKPRGGRLCCVFLVNGQRQEALDNTLIVQQLEFKYLRSRMMIIVDMDGLRPEALGKLMQGSRQSFYKGEVWDAVFRRLVATLKNDPELKQFEREAEAEVASLQGGDEKVREALDALIEAHHAQADHIATGIGPEAGLQPGGGLVGTGALTSDKVVELLSPDTGKPGSFPVLVASPARSPVRLRPGDEHVLVVTASPASKWTELTALTYHLDCTDGHLTVEENRSTTGATYTLRAAPEGDPDEYPVNCTLRVFARFAGYPQTRQLSVAVMIKPEPPKMDPDLKDDPTFLRVSSRQPVRLWNDGDTHVRLQWDGRDELAVGTPPAWTFMAECVNPAGTNVHTGFSQPREGRFSVVVGVPSMTQIGDHYDFLVVAVGPNGRTLSTTFPGIVTERKPKPVKPGTADEKEPRLIEGKTPSGSARRPPYDPKVITQDKWDSGTCWEGTNWTGGDPGVYQEPTQTEPLTLILNEDYEPLIDYRKYLVWKKYAENEIENRLRKYKTHMYYHLYQMYGAEKAKLDHADSAPEESSVKPSTAADRRAEIQRVALTLIKIMEVAR